MRKIALLLLLLAACKREEQALMPPQEKLPSNLPGAVQAAPPPPAPSGNAAGVSAVTARFEVNPGAAAPPFARMIVRTATISMIVGNTNRVAETITAAVEANGGWVNDSKLWREGEQLRATMSLRVPAARLTATLAAVRRLAVRVQTENISSEEVTQEYVDLQSQLRNLEATEEELRQLLITVRERAKNAADILEVHQHLVNIRAEIERTKGRMQYLSQMSSYSIISLDLVPDAVSKPVVQPGWQAVVVVRDAGRALLEALQAVATAAIWLVVYVLPIVLAFVVAAWITWKLLRHLRTRASAV